MHSRNCGRLPSKDSRTSRDVWKPFSAGGVPLNLFGPETIFNP
jgi:hypothetical protein